MKTFKQHFIIEAIAKTKHINNWESYIAANPMLSNAVDLMKEIEALEPSAEALIVGGTVRDILLGKEPKDVDIATNINIDTIVNNFHTADIGQSKDFGIVLVLYNGFEYEVAAYREDTYGSEIDARHPDSVMLVKSFEADSARRDLTINSMGLTVDGKIIDYQGGIEDIKNKIIRTVGDPATRFKEDGLRILRLVRFSIKLGFEIDFKTKNSAIELKDLIDNLSRERIAEELYKVASNGKNLANYIEELDNMELLEKTLPEVGALKGLLHEPKHHPEGNVWQHTMAALRVSKSNDPIANLAILFHDLGKGSTYKQRKGKHTYYGHDKQSAVLINDIAKRLKLKNEDRDAIMFAASKHMIFHKLEELSNKKLVALVNSKYWPILKAVGYSDEMSRGPDFYKGGLESHNRKVEYAERVAKELSAGGGEEGLRKRLKTIIDGNKIIQWVPDVIHNKPLIGDILDKVREHVINNKLFKITEEEVKALVIDLFDKLQSQNFKEFYSKDTHEKKVDM